MKAVFTVLPVNSQVAVVTWNIFHRLPGGSPGGFINLIDASTKAAAEAVATMMYGPAIIVELLRPLCSHCGSFLPCNGDAYGCRFPQSDGVYSLP